MKILVICGVYDENCEMQILKDAKGYVEQSANIFQRKLLRGLEANRVKYQVISAPLVGAYPMRSKKWRIKAFSPAPQCTYVPFHNLWGLRNFSRTAALKKEIRSYLREEKEELCILVYCAHTPFLKAALYAKSLRPKSRVCMVVPDLPQYMNLNATGRGLYDFLKKIDIRCMEKYISRMDSFVLLTEPMKQVLQVGDRPYTLVDGLVESDSAAANCQRASDGVKRIVYTGKMNVRFGLKTLVDAFMAIQTEDCRLVLCGDGDAREYVEEKAKIDPRIEYKGMVTAAQARKYVQQADVLVNPRPNNEEYTKYSFPSKNLEYLSSGVPLVAYKLDGISDEYDPYIQYVEDDTTDALRQAIERILYMPAEERCRLGNSARQFVLEKKNEAAQVRKILDMIERDSH